MKKPTKRKSSPVGQTGKAESLKALEQRAHESGARLDAALVQLTRELYWNHIRTTGDPEEWNKTFLALIAARKQALAEEKAREKKNRDLVRAEIDEGISLILAPAKNNASDSALQNKEV